MVSLSEGEVRDAADLLEGEGSCYVIRNVARNGAKSWRVFRGFGLENMQFEELGTYATIQGAVNEIEGREWNPVVVP